MITQTYDPLLSEYFIAPKDYIKSARVTDGGWLLVKADDVICVFSEAAVRSGYLKICPPPKNITFNKMNVYLLLKDGNILKSLDLHQVTLQKVAEIYAGKEFAPVRKEVVVNLNHAKELVKNKKSRISLLLSAETSGTTAPYNCYSVLVGRNFKPFICGYLHL
jgi:hypothetical protein